MTITLITGANKGLGFESARRLLALGHDVWIGARDAGRGRTAAAELGARFVHLDVTDDASVDSAAATLRAEAGRVDVLINNAGGGGGGSPADQLTAAEVQRVFEANVFGPVRVIHAFLPLLLAAQAPSVINVSSGLGSFHEMTRSEWAPFGSVAYSSSKAALTMATVQYARAIPAVRFNAVAPGFTAPDLTRHSGTQTVEEGTDAIARLATGGAGAATGTFTDRTGPVPW